MSPEASSAWSDILIIQRVCVCAASVVGPFCSFRAKIVNAAVPDSIGNPHIVHMIWKLFWGRFAMHDECGIAALDLMTFSAILCQLKMHNQRD